MKITGIKTAVVSCFGDTVFVKVFTDEGITGLGECYPSTPASAVQALVRHMPDLLLGEDPRNVDMLYEKVRRTHIFSNAQIGRAHV